MNPDRPIDLIFHKAKIKFLLLISLIILWGPPRGLDPARDVRASVSGSIGPYQYFIVAVYVIVGLVVLSNFINLRSRHWKGVKNILFAKRNVFFLIFVFWAIISSTYSKYPRLTLFFSYQLLITYLFFAIYSMKYSKEFIDKNKLINTLIIFLILNIFSNLFLYFTQNRMVAVDIGTLFPRLIGGAYFRTDYGLSSLVLFSWVLSQIKHNASLTRIKRSALVFLGCVSLLGIVLAQTRATFIVLLFILVLFFSEQNLFKNLFILISLVIFFTVFPFEKIYAFIIRDVKSLPTFSGRTILWRSLWPVLSENVFSGYGYYVGGRWIGFNYNTLRLGNLHNSYLELVAGVGIIPTIFFIVTLLGNFFTLLKGNYKSIEGYRHFFLSVWIIIILLSITNTEFSEGSPLTVIAIIFTYFIVDRKKINLAYEKHRHHRELQTR